MTNEEATKLLTQYIDYDAEAPDYYEMEEACKVAIKALEQQPCEDDVRKFISRQVSLLEERMSSATNEGRWVEEEKCQYAIENLELVDEYIKAHPPVTPKEKTGK